MVLGLDMLGKSISTLSFVINRLVQSRLIYALIPLTVLNGLFGQELRSDDTLVLSLRPFVVQGHQQFQKASDLNPLRTNWSLSDIREFGTQTVDQSLKQNPAFSFYRRQDATFANPTTQGVSLRNIGPTAAGRSLVLVDEIPQNDPFGGWVFWTQITPFAVEQASILPSSRAGAWGPLSAGGVIHIESASLPGDESIEFEAFGGSQNTISGALNAHQAWDMQKASLTSRFFETDGFYLIHPDDRGSIDRRSEHRHWVANLNGNHQIDENLMLQTRLSYFEEDRNNGTPLATNETESLNASIRLIGNGENGGWSALLYLQDREYRNTFTSVNADRTSENPVNDQFSIPSSAWGSKFSWQRSINDTLNLLAGVDLRVMEGQTNEDTGWGLTNRRKAGGKQWNAGAFAGFQYNLNTDQLLDIQIRLDRWQIWDGFRREIDKPTREITRLATYGDRSDWVPSASLSHLLELNQDWSIGWGAASSFRLPTINELYRPFRVRSDITEANPELKAERFHHVEAFLDGRFSSNWRIKSGIYHYWIEDAVANVYLFDGPANSFGGFVPAGGTFNQRQNVERAKVFAWETRLEWTIDPRISLSLHHLYSEAEFLSNATSPGLSGKAFPQIPQHKLITSLHYRPSDPIDFKLSWVHSSEQFDDPLNNRLLDAFDRLDLALSWDLNRRASLFARIHNLTDETILTGLASNGLRSVASPRRWVLGFQLKMGAQ